MSPLYLFHPCNLIYTITIIMHVHIYINNNHLNDKNKNKKKISFYWSEIVD